MGVRLQQSLSGFIASDPQLSYSASGGARFYARVGQEQFAKLDGGGFEKTGVEFTDLVQFGRAAERAKTLFRKGDVFVAEGYTHDYERKLDDGTVESRSEFVAKKLGHDAARTSYAVDRSTRRSAPAAQAPEAEPPTPQQTPVTGWPIAQIPQ